MVKQRDIGAGSIVEEPDIDRETYADVSFEEKVDYGFSGIAASPEVVAEIKDVLKIIFDKDTAPLSRKTMRTRLQSIIDEEPTAREETVKQLAKIDTTNEFNKRQIRLIVGEVAADVEIIKPKTPEEEIRELLVERLLDKSAPIRDGARRGIANHIIETEEGAAIVAEQLAGLANEKNFKVYVNRLLEKGFAQTAGELLVRETAQLAIMAGRRVDKTRAQTSLSALVDLHEEWGAVAKEVICAGVEVGLIGETEKRAIFNKMGTSVVGSFKDIKL